MPCIQLRMIKSLIVNGLATWYRFGVQHCGASLLTSKALAFSFAIFIRLPAGFVGYRMPRRFLPTTIGGVESVVEALSDSGLAADRLDLELTESVLLQDSAATLTVLYALRALGVRISMDDFGTGYSSLSYLRSFPFDKIKIDQSFIRDLSASQDSGAIVRAITGLGQNLGMRTTAEGVETAEQLARLQAEGCSEMQGYYFSRPVPAMRSWKIIRGLRQT